MHTGRSAVNVTDEVACGPISMAMPWPSSVKPCVRSSITSMLVTTTVTSSPWLTSIRLRLNIGATAIM